MLALIILGVILLAVVVYRYKVKENEVLKSIPGPKPLPIAGNVFEIGREGKGNTIQYFFNLKKKYGKLFKFYDLWEPTIFLTDVEDIEMIFKNNENITKQKSAIRIFRDWVGKGLIFSTDSIWKQQRRLITPAFHFNILERFYPIFDEQSDILIDILKEKAKNKDQFDATRYLERFALDVICETAMGTAVHAQANNTTGYAAAVRDIEKVITQRNTSFWAAFPPTFPYTEVGRSYNRVLKSLQDFTYQIIEKRREDLLSGKIEDFENSETSDNAGKKRLAFLDLLLHAKDVNGEPLSNELIDHEVNTFLFAGHETTTGTMSFALFELAKYPEIQEELYQEQCEILNNEDRSPTFKELNSMNVLERVIKETLRLYPAAPILGRQLTHDLQIKTNNYVLPKGTAVQIFVYALHRDPDVFPEPEKFDPDRFLPDNCIKRNPFAFVPFAAGMRNCIGMKFAMYEMKACLSKIIRNFKILPAYDKDGNLYELECKIVITLSSTNEKPIRLLSRK